MISKSAVLKISSERELFEQFEEFENELESILLPLREKLAVSVMGMSNSQLLAHMCYVESWRDRISRYHSLTITFVEHSKSSALFLESGDKKISAIERDSYKRKLAAGFMGYNSELENLISSIDSRVNIAKKIMDFEIRGLSQSYRV